MRLTDANKFYKKISPKQAATLAFEANVRRDEAELIAITECQPQSLFIGVSNAYRGRFMSLTMLSLFYAATYWRNRTILVQHASTHDEKELFKIATELGSLEMALIKTCERFGVNDESVKQLGHVPMEDSFGEYADEALIAEYIEVFMCFII